MVSCTYLSHSLGGRANADVLGFKLFHKQDTYNRTDGGTHGHAMNLFIILTIEENMGIFKQDFSSMVMCCMDMEVLLCSCGPCCNFCLMMGMAGSTGTDVKSTTVILVIPCMHKLVHLT